MSVTKHILFVCTGNICRSPMAEGLFRHLVRDRPGFTVSSAGVSAPAGYPPSAHAIEVLRGWGIDIARQRSQSLTERLVREADYIFAMTRSHLEAIVMLHPDAAEKTFLCRQFLDDADELLDVSDPIGLDIDAYFSCRDSIHGSLQSILDFIDQDLAAMESTASSPAAAPSRQTTRIALGADHGGVELKAALRKHLSDKGFAVADFGTQGEQSVDYPDFAAAVCKDITAHESDFGILICKTGVGMSIAANRFPGIRAALVQDASTARITREHNNSNVLCLAGTLSASDARRIADTFLKTEFQGGRHQTRVDKARKLAQPGASAQNLAQVDPEIAAAIRDEEQRQTENIELIASENFTSRAVMEAQGSCLTNKYAEGYPGRRWYGGCEHADTVEQLAIDRAKELFGADYVNVQPHSGSQANMAVYFSVLQTGDKILTMDLSHGGHLTHGNKANFSGRFFEVTHYGVSQEDERIDYDGLADQAGKVQPRMITAGASAYPRIIDFARMKEIADSVGALLFVDMAHIAGLVAGGVHPSPIGLADFVTTTTHKSLRGPRGGIIMAKEEFGKKIDSNVFPGIQGGPLMHVIAAKAVCFHEALQPGFKEYQQQIVLNAKALAARLTQHGYRLVSGGTENHLMLLDLRPQGLNGKIASDTLDAAGITVNKNGIPFDTEKITLGGGIRIGTPAVTTRGMKEEEMMDIADLIHEALQSHEDKAALEKIRGKVRTFTQRFPLP